MVLRDCKRYIFVRIGVTERLIDPFHRICNMMHVKSKIKEYKEEEDENICPTSVVRWHIEMKILKY